MLIASAATAAETYHLSMDRPSHAGDVFDFDGTFERRTHDVQTVQGQPPVVRDYAWAFHLIGRCTVLEVDEKGTRRKVKCEVAKAVLVSRGWPKYLLPAGCVIEATNKSGKEDYQRVDGVPINAQAIGGLREVFRIPPPHAPSGNDLFPPVAPRAVGDTWPMNVDRYADVERLSGYPPVPHVSGEAELVCVTSGPDGLATATVRETLKASGIIIPPRADRPGQTMSHGLSVIVDTAPLDPGKHGGTRVAKVTSDFVGHGAVNGSPVDLATQYVDERTLIETSVQR